MGLDGTAVQTASAPSIDITATIDPKTSFAHQQNGIPFVRELAVTNVGEGTLENVELIFSSDPAFMSGKKITLHRLGPGESYKAVAVDMVASATYLSEMRETIVARISVEAKCMHCPRYWRHSLNQIILQ